MPVIARLQRQEGAFSNRGGAILGLPGGFNGPGSQVTAIWPAFGNAASRRRGQTSPTGAPSQPLTVGRQIPREGR